ncbi:protein RoBo-1-like [Aotus nancymaae]|uniref:UPAR/Ly6 domain-containing protein n=1 Tax=Aotus nancymaae TaxID=37293 RepID=A0A2K5DDP1_AOTNA|nr:protein RoBo-1-like [Aotus nancymaae]
MEAVPPQEDPEYLKRIKGAIMSPSSSLKSLFIVCAFATFVFSTVVESVTCVQCAADGCSSTPGTCTNPEICFSIKKQFNITSPGQPILQKGCSSQCQPLAFSATLGDKITFGYGHQCCKTDSCNEADFQVARKSSDPNGIICPTCYSESDSTCNQTSLACQGEEKSCVVFTGSDNDKLSIFGMGCATESACNLKDVEVINNVKIRTFCANFSSGSPQLTPVISSILTALVLLKVLL